ncbi:FecR domain-containing protein [Flammeovirgaceae bacterium SG7u.111]|nr:FecR domain-containing protein [Flammeovirgaceae bacterium SG7u.132]WPO34616.1 FecR domain-containing protein [Flammeovirgaceae bacterium SG7u.111]
MKETKFITLVTKRLAKELSAKESEELDEMLQVKKNRELFIYIKKGWDNFSDHIHKEKFSHRRTQNMLVDKIKKHEPNFGLSKVQKEEAKVVNLYRLASKVAAVVALFGMLLYGLLQFNSEKQNSPSFDLVEKITEPGQRNTIKLADKSEIIMNAESQLTFKKPFQNKLREFDLEGEAFFKVEKNPEAPFRVNFKGLIVEVVGTQFNISSYPESDSSFISLVEGSIKILNESDSLLYTLEPGDQLVFDNSSKTYKLSSFDLVKTIGWKDDILIFDNERLGDVLPILERHYGVDFNVRNPSILNCQIKADFDSKPLSIILESLQFAGDWEFNTTDQKHYILHGHGCK